MKTKFIKNNIAAACLFIGAFATAQQSDRDIIDNYLKNSKFLKNTDQTVEESYKILKAADDKNLHGRIVNIQQTYDGVGVYGAISSVLIKQQNVSYFSDNFRPVRYSTKIKGTAKKGTQINISAEFPSILSKMGLKSDASLYTFQAKKKNSVIAELTYLPDETSDQLTLAYALNFFEDGTNNFWNVLVDAGTGEILRKSNLTQFDNFHHDAYSGPKAINPKNSPAFSSQKSMEANISKTGTASYRVYALPLEAPSFGERTLLTNPWSDASPLGWHNDGSDSYTTTRGNNTYTYADTDGSNTVSYITDGGSELKFDFPLDDPKGDPENYTDAAITNLFYMNNTMHDIFYKFGFDEAGRNFQQTNFGLGDLYTDEDPVLAEARDGADYSNANFATPPDGYAGRMQMYLWLVGNYLTYNTPEDMVGRKPNAGVNVDFGGQLTEDPIVADIVEVTPADGCAELDDSIDLQGKIALIERGTCTFATKFRNAQNKGASAVIIYAQTSSTPIVNMYTGDTEDASDVTIPGIMINYEEASLIKSKLEQQIPVNVNLKYGYSYRDGSLDNGIIAHEYTHGISTRSTGNGYSCLDATYANEQMGEGWSDFFALMLTNPADATSATSRGLGTFVINEDTDETGIRPAKYSTDFNINGYTYGDTNQMTDAHDIGFVWATMLWDLSWKFAEKYGFSNDIVHNMDSGSAKVVQLVFNAFKLQGCFPSFVKGRDAIIAADGALNNGENKCMIWETFAKRGLGVNADPGSTSGVLQNAFTDQVEDFTVPSECQNMATDETAVSSNVRVYPNPVKNDLHIITRNKNAGKTKIAIYDISGRLINQEMTNLSSGEATLDMSALPNGVYVVKGEGIGVAFSKKVVVKK